MSKTKTYFTDSHEWIAADGTVGITQYAQSELGEIVAIELPKVGQMVRLGDEVVVLESTKAAADVYAPVSGRVIKINEELAKTPDLINRAPESSGWLFQLECSDPHEFNRLMTLAEYVALIEQ